MPTPENRLAGKLVMEFWLMSLSNATVGKVEPPLFDLSVQSGDLCAKRARDNRRNEVAGQISKRRFKYK